MVAVIVVVVVGVWGCECFSHCPQTGYVLQEVCMCKSENESRRSAWDECRRRARAGEVLGMSAGEERSALAGGGWANFATVFFVWSSFGFCLLQVLSFSGFDR